MYIKTGDLVAVIAGRDKFTTDKKGNKVRTTGKVLKVFPKENRIVVEGVNIVKKHQAPTQNNDKGGIISVEAPINISNVQIIDPKTNKPSRVGYKIVDGKKVRYAKKSGTVLDK